MAVGWILVILTMFFPEIPGGAWLDRAGFLLSLGTFVGYMALERSPARRAVFSSLAFVGLALIPLISFFRL